MGFFRLLAVPLLISVCAAAQTSQTKRLPQECFNIESSLPPLKNPFTPSVLPPQLPFRLDRIDLSRIISPQQFQVHAVATANQFIPGSIADHYYADVLAHCRALSSANAGQNMY
jgi:hypothetical protein